MTTKSLVLSSSLLFAVACGPAGRSDNFGDDTGHADSGSTNTGPEICTDNVDNDGDGLVDCHDPDCSGRDGCPVCGQVENPEGSGIFLPDGVSSGGTCSVDADCPAATPNCIAFVDTANGNAAKKECHASYTSKLDFIGFPMGAKLDDTSKLLKVCATLEHSYLHDLNFELISPSGQSVGLQKFLGRVGPKIFLGIPVDADDSNPQTGVGYDYCWTAGTTATSTMLMANMMQAAYPTVPAGDYKPDVPFTALQGADLNGTWTFRVTDMYSIDNGHLFKWSINFDPSLVVDCSGPIIQ